MRLDGKVGIVTGAGGGIGAALAARFVAEGMRVAVTDLDEAALAATAERISAGNADSVVALAGDASATDHIVAVRDLAERTFGTPVDLYAANAGVMGGLELGTPEQWATAWDVNVMAHVRAAEVMVPGWVERGSGYFLATASAAGLLTQIGSAIYSTTKHAAVGFAEWLSVTYGDQGVTVSCLCPMGVRTAMLTGGAESDNALDRQSTRAVTEAGDVLEPDEVAAIVVAGLEAEQFLILPHPQVLEFFRRKASDHDRWLAGMRRYQASLR